MCDSKEQKEWQGYNPCDEMRGWVLSEIGPWWWHEGRQQDCHERTYVKYDLHIPGHVCDTKVELVCRDVKPTPTPTLPVPELPICPDCVERVMFQSDRDGNWEIYRADADGSNPARLTNNDANDESPHWQPQGVWVVFQSNRDGNWEVYRMNNDGLDQRNLSENPYADMAPFMSCRWVYFQGDRDGNWEIYRMDFDGSNQTRLTIDPGTDAQPSASCLERVVFQSNRDGNWEIYSMAWDGTDLRRPTYTDRDEISPTWSPDGTKIIFQVPGAAGASDLWIMDANGQNAHVVTDHPGDEDSPVWWPSCEWVYFQTKRDGDWEIYRVPVPNPGMQRVTDNDAMDLIDRLQFPPGPGPPMTAQRRSLAVAASAYEFTVLLPVFLL